MNYKAVMPLYFDTIRDSRKVHARLNDGSLACHMALRLHCWGNWYEVDKPVTCKRCLKALKEENNA